ncbi:MAG: hypothetical protein JXR97_15985, partial [Planctomycetes bacterium]|nr:hypothetical protein [Planctomycetota bacterium]
AKIESAFHKLEIKSREISGQYPLRLMDRVYNSWLYDGDPLHLLRLDSHLKELRRLFEEEKGFFENLLREMIVQNPHYSVLTFVPDNRYNAKKDEAFAGKMEKTKAGLSKEEMEKIDREARELEEMQGAPNTPEAIATLPRLAISDVAPEPIELPTKTLDAAGQTYLHTDVFAGGISYIRLAFDLSGIDDGLYDYLPLYAEAMSKMGAAGSSYVTMAERDAACTGGIGAGVTVSGKVDDPNFVLPLFTAGMKALDTKLPEALKVLEDRLLRCDLSDTERLRDVILQGKVRAHSSLIPAGNRFASLYAARNLSRNASLAERMGGISQIRFFDKLAAEFEKNRDGIIAKLAEVQEFLLAGNRITASVVANNGASEEIRNWLGATISGMKKAATCDESSEWTAVTGTRTGIASPADVAFVARAFPTVGFDHPDAPALLLLGTQLSYGYLWNEVRVKGGAYGARAAYSGTEGLFGFASYRDPHIAQTLKAYDGVFDFIRNGMDLSADGVEQAIIGTVKSLDTPLRPEQAVATALSRHLIGNTPEKRGEFRSRLLSLKGEDIARIAGEVLLPQYKTSPVAVLSSKEKLTAASKSIDGGIEIEDL